jgi:hypothetical protein
MTAIGGTVFTAAQYNTFVRDNLNETMPGRDFSAGSWFITQGPHRIIQLTPDSDQILNATGGVSNLGETTDSTGYSDLDTVGPTVTVETNTRALVIMYCQMTNSTASVGTWMSYEVTGATTSEAQDNRALLLQANASRGQRASAMILHQDLTPGLNTFNCKYRVSSGKGYWHYRRLAVIPM